MIIKFKKYWRKSSLKKPEDGIFLLNHILKFKPKSFLEIGVFHGVTSRNVCELLFSFNENNFLFTGIDLFSNDATELTGEIAPKTDFSNPLKRIYYNYIIRQDPYSYKAVVQLLKKFKNNVNIIKGNSNIILKDLNVKKFDYIFLDGGHKYDTVKNDLECLLPAIVQEAVVLCDDYNLSYAPGVKEAIDEFVEKNRLNIKILNSRFAEITKKK
jgi:predicted O-methyltransferase YrrM